MWQIKNFNFYTIFFYNIFFCIGNINSGNICSGDIESKITDELPRSEKNAAQEEAKRKELDFAIYNLDFSTFKNIENKVLPSADNEYFNQILTSLFASDIDMITEIQLNISTIITNAHEYLISRSGDSIKEEEEDLFKAIFHKKAELRNNKLCIFKDLLKKYSHVRTIKNDQKQTLLHLILKNNLHEFTIFVLHESNTNIDFCQDEHGYTAFDYAVDNKNIGFLDMLKNNYVLESNDHGLKAVTLTNYRNLKDTWFYGQGNNACILKINLTTLIKILDDNYPLSSTESTSILQKYILKNASLPLSIVKLLIKRGANVNSQDNNNNTPLHLAFLKNNIEIAHMLIDAGADVNITNSNDNTPLDIASRNHINIGTILLTLGTNEHESNNLAALVYAIKNNYIKIANHIIKLHPDLLNKQIDQRFYNENTILNDIMNQGDIKKIKYLLQAGADPNIPDADGTTPLIHAILTSYVKTFDILIQAGANVNQPDAKGITPVTYAIQQKNTHMLNALIIAGAEIQQKEHRDAVILLAQKKLLKSLKICFNKGIDVNTTDDDDTTLLAKAVANKDITTAEFLISQGADPNKTTKHKAPQLMIAVNNQDLAMIKILLAAKANPTQAYDGFTPLSIAKMKNNQEIIDVLEAAIDHQKNNTSHQ